MGSYLLAVDAGSTVTKAVLFDETGTQLGIADERIPHRMPAPHHVERDQDAVWRAVCRVIGTVLQVTGVSGDQVRAIGITSHGDGIYLVDRSGRPTRPGILSLDTRSAPLVATWQQDAELMDRLLTLTGQLPWAGAPLALLVWLSRFEPEVLAATAYALPAKDALKHRLTGEFSTDPTEASLSFTNVNTQSYDPAVLELVDAVELNRLLPPVVPSGGVAGYVTAAAAEQTGLRPGTPVAGGAHDVDCGALGLGVTTPGQLAMIAGTFSINEVISDAVHPDRRWNARSFVEPGLWMNMSLSPSSATNLEWFTHQLAALDLERSSEQGDAFGFVERDIATVANDPSEVIYLPFLYGSPYPADASASFFGLRGWHRRGHLLRAVLEGVAFNHRYHVDALAERFPISDIRLTGGATNSERWSQLFADVLNRPVEVGRVREAGALGCVQLAGQAVGLYAGLAEAVEATDQGRFRFEPDPVGAERMQHAFERYSAVAAALLPLWETSRPIDVPRPRREQE